MGVEIPTPDRGVQPQRQGGGAFGSSAFPGLWVLAAKILFHVAVANLDRPAAGVAGGGLGAGGGQVGGEEVVVVLDPVGVADDDQADQTLLVDPVPEHVADVDQAGDLLATLVDLDFGPVAFAGLGGQLGWFRELGSSGSGPAAFAGVRWGGLVQAAVAAHPRGQVRAVGEVAGQGGVGAVGGQVQVAARKPAGDLAHHVRGVGDGGGVVVLAVQAGVDRDRDRAAAPRCLYAQADHDQVQPVRVDDLLHGGAHGVAEGAGAVDVPTALVVQGVVADQFDDPVRGEAGHGVHAQRPPQRVHVPRAVA